MLDLTKVQLPGCIECRGKYYNIRTDFRIWLGFSRTLNKRNAVVDDADFVYADSVPPAEEKPEAFRKLIEFYMPANELPRKTDSGEDDVKLLDYIIDADLIYAAFYEQYGIDLLAADRYGHAVQMHWHRFLALLSGLHNTKLNEVMGWRCWNGDSKTEYGKQMQRLRNAWELPEEKDEKVQEDLEKFNALFENKND